MKSLKTAAISALLSLFFLHAGAQEERIPINQPDYNKPKLFNDLPEKMDLPISNMEFLLDQPEGTQVTAKFSKDFYLKGTVISRSKDASVQSVVIRASNRQGAIFTFTKITDREGSVVYRGRITSRDNGDAFVVTGRNNQYFLEKKNYHEIVAE